MEHLGSYIYSIGQERTKRLLVFSWSPGETKRPRENFLVWVNDLITLTRRPRDVNPTAGGIQIPWGGRGGHIVPADLYMRYRGPNKWFIGFLKF